MVDGTGLASRVCGPEHEDERVLNGLDRSDRLPWAGTKANERDSILSMEGHQTCPFRISEMMFSIAVMTASPSRIFWS